MKNTTVFNTICFLLLVCFVTANVFVWRNKIFVHSSSVLLPVAREVDTFETHTGEEAPPVTSTAALPSHSTSTSSSLSVIEIPKEINLSVPFTSQAPEKNWDQPWQDACEEAAVLMLDAYYKKNTLSPLFAKDEILKMVEWEEQTKQWGRSIEIEKVKELVEYYSKKSSRIIENPTVEQIKQFIAAGTPVAVVADGKILPNPHFQNGGPVYHALIIRGFTQTHFITNDPGTQFGENFLYTYHDLMNAIRDWNGGDVKQGRRVVLVFE